MIHAERRREPRVRTHNLVVAEFDGEGCRSGLALGRTLDLSRGGMRLELSHPLRLGADVTLSLALGNKIIDVEGKVCWVSELDSENWSMGMVFTDLSTSGHEALQEYLRARG